MKKTLLTILLCIICICAKATGQIHDKVNIAGDVWEMPSSPLEYLEPGLQDAFSSLIGERDFMISSNWRGYVAYWYVRGGRLYLEKVEVPQKNGRYMALDSRSLKRVFRKYSRFGKIKAGWITGKITIGKGMAEEKTLILKKGRIIP
jgi:hypothetical protein